MMKIRFLFLLLVFPLFFGAQILKPDFKAIEENLFNPESKYNYDKLIFKFKGYPKALDNIEAQYLYYGRNFNKNNISTTDDSFSVLAKYFKENNFSECIKYGRQLYNQDPTNLDVILILLRAYDNAADSSNVVHHISQLRLLTDAIKSSGDGKSEKTPYLVNSVGDEYIFLNILNVGEDYIRSSKTLKDGVLDIWEKGDQKIYIKVLYID